MYRQTRNYENLNRHIFDGVGAYGIPRLTPTTCKADDFIGFYCRSVTTSCGYVFFMYEKLRYNNVGATNGRPKTKKRHKNYITICIVIFHQFDKIYIIKMMSL